MGRNASRFQAAKVKLRSATVRLIHNTLKFLLIFVNWASRYRSADG